MKESSLTLTTSPSKTPNFGTGSLVSTTSSSRKSNGFWKSLKPEERHRLKKFQKGDHLWLNAYLREGRDGLERYFGTECDLGKLELKSKRAIGELDSILELSPKRQWTLWRSLILPPGVGEKELFKIYEPGAVVTIPTFLSCSLKPSILLSHPSGAPSLGFRLSVKDGAPLKREILLKRGKSFKVLGREKALLGGQSLNLINLQELL